MQSFLCYLVIAMVLSVSEVAFADEKPETQPESYEVNFVGFAATEKEVIKLNEADYTVRSAKISFGDQEKTQLLILFTNLRRQASNFEDIKLYAGKDWVKGCEQNCGWQLVLRVPTNCDELKYEHHAKEQTVSFLSRTGKKLLDFNLNSIILNDVKPVPLFGK